MLPQEFIDEVRPLLGGELDAFLRALNEPRRSLWTARCHGRRTGAI